MSQEKRVKKGTSTSRRAAVHDWIRVRGASTHNLKHIDVDIPRNMLTVCTGLSGSGKSSLAFDTIFAEGQRRYVESLSAYARRPECTKAPNTSLAYACESTVTGNTRT